MLILRMCMRIGFAAVLVLGLGWVGVTTAVPASASEGGRGPSAGADVFGNEFVFWRDTQNHLTEAYYDTYTGKWNGPVHPFAGRLGSQPAVAVSPRTSAGPGDRGFGNLYVFWKGSVPSSSGHIDIWYAWWGASSPGRSGKWHGPHDLGSITAGVNAEPTAAVVNCGVTGCGYDPVDVYYKDIHANLNVAYSNNAQAGGWRHLVIHGQGPIGSSPSVSEPATYTNLDQVGQIVWQGTDRGLWASEYFCDLGAISCSYYYRQKYSSAGTLGSPPSTVGEPTMTKIETFWRGTDRGANLYECQHPDPSFPCPRFEIPRMGPLGSAPTAAWTSARPSAMYVFWKGTDGTLWEGFRHSGCFCWSRIHLSHMGQIGGLSP